MERILTRGIVRDDLGAFERRWARLLDYLDLFRNQEPGTSVLGNYSPFFGPGDGHSDYNMRLDGCPCILCLMVRCVHRCIPRFVFSYLGVRLPSDCPRKLSIIVTEPWRSFKSKRAWQAWIDNFLWLLPSS